MSGEMKDYVWCGCGDGYQEDSWMAGFMSKAGKCHACDLSDAAPPPPEDGWMDIDDAAKSGKWVLLSGRCYRTGAPAMVCRWDGCEWESADDGCGTYIAPTHWRELPPPPPAALTKEP